VVSRIERAGAGDTQAWAELYDLHHAQLRRFARRLLGDADAAEDLLHDVFALLPNALRSYRGDAELSTFLLAIAARRAKNHVRAAARRRRAFARLAQEPPSAERNPEHESADRELREALSRALDALPLAQRLAFVLCELEDRTSEEAAKILDVPAATVRTRLHHARKQLQQTFSVRSPQREDPR
jgi:RNA polymerase sigma-70 factor (ECF subfamily)